MPNLGDTRFFILQGDTFFTRGGELDLVIFKIGFDFVAVVLVEEA